MTLKLTGQTIFDTKANIVHFLRFTANRRLETFRATNKRGVRATMKVEESVHRATMALAKQIEEAE